MNIAAVKFPVFNPYNKPTVEIYVSGCKINCQGCHNKELQNFNYGEKLDVDKIIFELYKIKDWFNSVSILGGEPLDQNEYEFKDLMYVLKCNFPLKDYWIFTGYGLNKIPEWSFLCFDYIKYGPYIKELKQEGFPSSSNQKLLKRGVDY